MRRQNDGVLVFDSEINVGQPLTGTSYTIPGGYLESGYLYKWDMRSHSATGYSNSFSTDFYFQLISGVDIRIDPLSVSFNQQSTLPIYVELDWMEDGTHSHKPSQAVIDRIVQTFSRAGYEINIDVSNAIPHQTTLAVINPSVASSVDVQAIMSQNFNHSGDSQYYYSLWGHDYSLDGDSNGSSGVADPQGRVHLVTLGSFSGQTGTFSNQVGTFIHEFGHNVGQNHGGEDTANYKPNYLSVMNYHYQLHGLGASLLALEFANTASGFDDFSYSHGLLPNLNEANLNEGFGIGLGRAIDWNCNGTIETASVAKDIQGKDTADRCFANFGQSMLVDFDNWTDLAPHIRTLGAAAKVAGQLAGCITADENKPMAEQIEGLRTQGLLPPDGPGSEPAQTKGFAGHSFLILNDGGGALTVSSLSLDTATSWISWEPQAPFTVEPGGTQEVLVFVDFAQVPAGQTTRRLLVQSNDPDESPYPGGVNLVISGLGAPDLVAEGPGVSDTMLEPSQNFLLAVSVRNQGDLASESSTLRYFVSANSTISTSDTQLDSDTVLALSPGGSEDLNEFVVAPSTPGTYWVGGCVDPISGESMTSNNCSTGVEVVVGGAPDPVAEGPGVSDMMLDPSQNFLLGVSVRNQGDLASDSTTLRYFVSTDSTISTSDTQLGSDTVSALSPGSSEGLSELVQAPSSPGTYWVGGCVDPVSGESVTSNNCSTAVEVVVSDSGTIFSDGFESGDTSAWSNMIGLCGDGSVNGSEGCDDGGNNGPCPAICSAICTVNSCVSNVPPILSLTQPDGIDDIADDSFTIRWTDEDPDDDATISLYYDTDAAGEDGTPIINGLSEDDSTDSYTWDTALLPDGTYYNYAIIDDGINLPVTSYSTGTVIIDHFEPTAPELVWQQTGTLCILQRPALGNDGLLYTIATDAADCSSEGRGITSIDPSDGSVLWGPHTPGGCTNVGVRPISVGSDGLIYGVGDWNHCGNGRIFAYASDGTLAWNGSECSGSPHPRQTPALNESINSLYYGAASLCSVDITSRATNWSQGGGYYIGARGMAIDSNDHIYYGSHSGSNGDTRIRSLASDGSFRWNNFYEGMHGPTIMAALSDGTILGYHQAANVLFAWNDDGTDRWQANALTNPVVDEDGFIYANSTENSDVVSLSATGIERWRRALGGASATVHFVDDNGRLYAHGENILYAVNTNDGSIVWEFSTISEIQAPPVLVPGGRIFLQDANLEVYLLNTTLEYSASAWPIAGYGNRRHTQKSGDILSLPTLVAPTCGNGSVESGEACDEGGSNGPCPASCSKGTGSDMERLWWTDRPAATQWIPALLPAPAVGEWYAIDITDLYNAWQSGTYPNYGLQLRPGSPGNNTWAEFYSANYTGDPTFRPNLVIVSE